MIDRIAAAGGCDPAAVGAVGHRVDRAVVAAEGEQLGAIQMLEEVPLPAAPGRLAAIEDGLGLGDVGGLVLEAGAGDLAGVEAARGPVGGVARLLLLDEGAFGGGDGLDPLLVLGLALGHRLPPLPGDQAEARPEDQRQCRQQAGRHRVAPAPAEELLALGGASCADRAVLEEEPQVLGHLGGRLVAVVGVAFDRLVDHGLQVARDLAVELPQPGRLVGGDPADQPVRSVSSKAGRRTSSSYRVSPSE